jgi:hypothetical protein
MIYEHIKELKFFSIFFEKYMEGVEKSSMATFCRNLSYERIPMGTYVFLKGDPSNDKLYVILDGKVGVVIADEANFFREENEQIEENEILKTEGSEKTVPRIPTLDAVSDKQESFRRMDTKSPQSFRKKANEDGSKRNSTLEEEKKTEKSTALPSKLSLLKKSQRKSQGLVNSPLIFKEPIKEKPTAHNLYGLKNSCGPRVGMTSFGVKMYDDEIEEPMIAQMIKMYGSKKKDLGVGKSKELSGIKLGNRGDVWRHCFD